MLEKLYIKQTEIKDNSVSFGRPIVEINGKRYIDCNRYYIGLDDEDKIFIDKNNKEVTKDYLNKHNNEYKHTLYRIYKLNKNKNKLKAGGYIEHEGNLSTNSQDTAWIYNEAQVYGKAHVCDKAQVFGKGTKVFDDDIFNNNTFNNNTKVLNSDCTQLEGFYNTKISDNAQVYDNSCACHNVKMSGKSKLYNNSVIFNNVKLFGNTEVSNNSVALNNIVLSNNAIISHNSSACNNITLSNDVKICNNSNVFSNTNISKNPNTSSNSYVFNNVIYRGNNKKNDNSQWISDIQKAIKENTTNVGKTIDDFISKIKTTQIKAFDDVANIYKSFSNFINKTFTIHDKEKEKDKCNKNKKNTNNNNKTCKTNVKQESKTNSNHNVTNKTHCGNTTNKNIQKEQQSLIAQLLLFYMVTNYFNNYYRCMYNSNYPTYQYAY